MEETVILGIDVETVGGNGPVCELAVAAITTEGEELDVFQTLVDPGDVEWSEFVIRQIHGITPDVVRGSPAFGDAWASMMSWMGGFEGPGLRVFAHNAGFERGVFAAQVPRGAKRLDIECSCDLSRSRHPELRSHTLGVMCEHLRVPLEDHHRALPDAWASAHIARLLLHGGLAPRCQPTPRPLRMRPAWTANEARGSNPALRASTPVISNRLVGELIVFTGTPYSVEKREQLKRLVISHGADVGDHVTTRTTMLVVCGHRHSVPETALRTGKPRKAREVGCEVVSEGDLIARLATP